jgi:CheY-like chemotaxis protein
MHGGSVRAHSDGVDAGSEFTVELPALAATTATTAGARKLDAFPPRRILIVDDNRDAADTLGRLLRQLGATVAVEYGGDAALAALERFKPDAVLLDIGMPGMDGYEVARRIRADGDGNVPQLIALTGWGQDQDYRRSQLAGFDHHLVKPPNIQRLRSLLRGV